MVDDVVQGRITFRNDTLDDLILLHSDGTPTYMLAVVVDDHDLGVTHVIRGDDHLTNAARQTLTYKAIDWPVPIFAHIPLIHGPNSAKPARRRVEAYRDMGYPAEAMRNYLAQTRLEPRRRRILHDRSGDHLVRHRQHRKVPSPNWILFRLENLSGRRVRATADACLREIEEFLAATQRPPLTAAEDDDPRDARPEGEIEDPLADT